MGMNEHGGYEDDDGCIISECRGKEWMIDDGYEHGR